MKLLKRIQWTFLAPLLLALIFIAALYPVLKAVWLGESDDEVLKEALSDVFKEIRGWK